MKFILFCHDWVLLAIGGGKGGAIELQLHLILRVLHRTFIFAIEKSILVLHLPPPLLWTLETAIF